MPFTQGAGAVNSVCFLWKTNQMSGSDKGYTHQRELRKDANATRERPHMLIISLSQRV